MVTTRVAGIAPRSGRGASDVRAPLLVTGTMESYMMLTSSPVAQNGWKLSRKSAILAALSRSGPFLWKTKRRRNVVADDPVVRRVQAAAFYGPTLRLGGPFRLRKHLLD